MRLSSWRALGTFTTLLASILAGPPSEAGKVIHYEAADHATGALGAWCPTRGLSSSAKKDALLPDGWTALTLAAEMGDDEAIISHLRQGAGIDIPDESGRTALARACYHGHLDAVRVLLVGGANVHLTNADGTSALWIASAAGHKDVVRLLLNASTATLSSRQRQLEEEVRAAHERRSQDAASSAADEAATAEAAKIFQPPFGAAAATPWNLPLLTAGDETMALAEAAVAGPRELMVARHRRARQEMLEEGGVDTALVPRGSSLLQQDPAVADHASAASSSAVSAMEDVGLAVKQLMAHSTQAGHHNALQIASRRGHEDVAELLREPEYERAYRGIVPAHLRGSIPPAMVRAAEGDIRAVEAWLRSGAMGAVNDTAALEAGVQGLLASWGGHSLDMGGEEEVLTVINRMRSRGVWVDLQQRVCGGFVLRVRSQCYVIEIERALLPADNQEDESAESEVSRGRPSVAISRRRRLSGYLGQRIAVKRKLATSTHATPPEMPGDQCAGYDCCGCDDGDVRRQLLPAHITARDDAAAAAMPAFAALPFASSPAASTTEARTMRLPAWLGGLDRWLDGFELSPAMLALGSSVASLFLAVIVAWVVRRLWSRGGQQQQQQQQRSRNGRRRNRGGGGRQRAAAAEEEVEEEDDEVVEEVAAEAMAMAMRPAGAPPQPPPPAAQRPTADEHANNAPTPPGESTMMMAMALRLGQTRGRAVVIGRPELTTGTRGFADELKIGEGGFGSVWKASPLPSLGVGAFAVKKLHTQPNRPAPFLNLLEEVELLGKLNHPNVLAVLAYSLDPSSPCLVYPLARGGSFQDRLIPSDDGEQRLNLLGLASTAPLTWRHRLHVLRDVAAALVYLHTPTDTKPLVVHRDVKPSNVVLSLVQPSFDDDGAQRGSPPLTAWLCDVGMAKTIDPPSLQLQTNQNTHLSTGTVRGTPGFVDSLVVNGLQHSEATDGFALGVTLLMSLTGLPAVGLTAKCQRMLRNPTGGDTQAWRHLLDGDWPLTVASEMADIAKGLTMPAFKDDRTPIPEALRRIEAALAANPPQAAAVADPVEDGAADELRACVICDDAPREVRFRCGHACCCVFCAELVQNTGDRCPICRSTAHPLIETGAQLRDAATFELPPAA